MGSSALIAAHNNVFNKAVLGTDAFYFSNEDEIADIIKTQTDKQARQTFIRHNIEKIRTQYNWARIVNMYEAVMLEAASL
jgi:glycosyltransferase involved in cell wall biosynthesis